MMAAARAMSYTQPAISHHIARLEAEVGTPLVTRHGRGVRLTQAGMALAAHAEAVIARLADAEEEIAAIAGLRAGRVRVAAFPTTAAFLPEALVALRAEAPALAVSVSVDAEPPEALAELRRGDADVAIVFSYRPARGGAGGSEPDGDAEPGFDSIRLFEESISIVAQRRHPLAADGEASLARWADEPWIAGCARCRANLLAAFHRAGVMPTIAYSADDYLAVQRMVANGLAVAALPALAFALHDDSGVVRLPAPELGTRLVTAVAATPPRPPAVEALLAELLRATAHLRVARPDPSVPLGHDVLQGLTGDVAEQLGSDERVRPWEPPLDVAGHMGRDQHVRHPP